VRRRLWEIGGPIAGSGAVLALAYSPWGHAPSVLGVLRGPMAWALVGLGVAIAATRSLAGGLRWPDPAPAKLFLGSALALVLIGQYYTSRLRVSGDEPHYLLMAQSLWREHDLDLQDNLARQDYLEYTPGPVAPHWGTPRRDGRPFPAHSPGLPALLAPVYALGGRRACAALLALAAAALALQVQALARHVTGDPRAALLAWLVAVGPPVLFYSFLVYTEVPSALALATALRLLLALPGPWGAALAAGCASLLPWLHVKMVPAAAVLGLIAVWRLRGGSRLTFVAVSGAMAAAYLVYYHSIFGVASPLAIYGGVPDEAAVGSPLRAAVGLLLDRSFGLLWYAPVMVLALAGLQAWVRGKRADVVAHGLVGAAVLLPLGTWRMWWGGQCPPGRFLVPLVPLLALAAAARLAEDGARLRGLSRWWAVLVGLGLGLALFMIARPAELMLLNRGDRPTRVWASLSGEVPIERYLPSMVADSGDELRVAILWLAALALLLGLDRWAPQHERVDAAFRSLGMPLVLAGLVGILVDAWARPREGPDPAPVRLPSSTNGAASDSPRARSRKARPG
jgi:hypothetical protein